MRYVSGAMKGSVKNIMRQFTHGDSLQEGCTMWLVIVGLFDHNKFQATFPLETFGYNCGKKLRELCTRTKFARTFFLFQPRIAINYLENQWRENSDRNHTRGYEGDRKRNVSWFTMWWNCNHDRVEVYWFRKLLQRVERLKPNKFFCNIWIKNSIKLFKESFSCSWNALKFYETFCH